MILLRLHRLVSLLVIIFLVRVIQALPPRACVKPHDIYPFCNASLPLDERLDDILSRLTVDEKPYLLVARESPKGNISRLGIPECKSMTLLTRLVRFLLRLGVCGF